jgi:hypothetical protein
MIPRLQCSLLSEQPSSSNRPQDTNATDTAFLKQESGKKSSFLLAAKGDSKVCLFSKSKPAHLVIERREGNIRHPFFLGGFQIVSNSRNVEVYLSDKEGKEEYLMTSRGLLVDDNATSDGHWHKAVSVVPGGPREITRLHVKLLSLRPSGEVSAKLQFMKVTARLPEIELSLPPPHDNNNNNNNSSDRSASANNVPTVAPLTQSDLGAAMASMSIIARAAEDRLEKSMKAQIEGALGTRWTSMEQHVLSLTSAIISQKNVMEQQNQLVLKQQEMLENQERVLNTLLNRQSELLSTFHTLQQDIAEVKKHTPNDDGDDAHGQSSNDSKHVRLDRVLSETALSGSDNSEDTIGIENQGNKESVLSNSAEAENVADDDSKDAESKSKIIPDSPLHGTTIVEKDTVGNEQRADQVDENLSGPEDASDSSRVHTEMAQSQQQTDQKKNKVETKEAIDETGDLDFLVIESEPNEKMTRENIQEQPKHLDVEPDITVEGDLLGLGL